MVEFAGYEMPISYSSIQAEHHAVRESVGIFDVSHMGEFVFKGDHAADLIQRLTSNNIAVLKPGKAQYSCFVQEDGGIVDDLIVYPLEDGNWMLVVNASNIEKDWNWLQQYNDKNVESHNVSDQTTLLAVQGPKAQATLQKLTDSNLDEIGFYEFAKGTLAGVENVLISGTGYTGSGGFELYFEKEHSEKIWNAIMEAGAEFDIKPCGLAARDTLRLEMGFCLYGNDIDEKTSPLEAGLGWITKLKAEENQFVGRPATEKIKADGLTRRLVGFELTARGIPRQGCPIKNAEGQEIGVVTSGTMGPSVKKALGMGYVSIDHKAPDTEIFIDIRNKLVPAKVVKTPFYQAG